MARRTPPPQYWANLLRGSLAEAATPTGESVVRAAEPAGPDDVVAKAIAGIERHAVSAAEMKGHLRKLCAEAGAAIQSAAIRQATAGPGGTAPTDEFHRFGQTLDVRR